MSGTEPKRSFRTQCAALLREPLVHFLCVAALLTYAYHVFGKPEVAVSPQLLGSLRKEYELAQGRGATAEEVKKIGDNYLEDEILFREALRSELTKDPRVRSLLIQTMRDSLRPIVPQPSDAELEAMRAETPEIYRYPAQISFEHVSFQDAAGVPAGLLEKLRGGEPYQGLGDPKIRLANPLPLTYRPQIDHLFGREFTEAIFHAKQGVWIGPLTTTRGVHFVRVIRATPEREMPMSELRPTLQAKWMARKESEEITRKVIEMKNSYRVNAPKADAKP